MSAGDALRLILIGNHALEYQTNAEFHAVVDGLVAGLPAFLEFMLVQARENEERRQRLTQEALRSPLPPGWPKVSRVAPGWGKDLRPEGGHPLSCNPTGCDQCSDDIEREMDIACAVMDEPQD